jgi:hypothetical protein
MIEWFRNLPWGIRIMLGIGAFFILCAMICCSNLILDNSPATVEIHDSTETSIDVNSIPKPTKKPKETEKPKETKKGLETIEASKLIEDYKSNEIKADTLYKNKRFKIKGIVREISDVAGILIVRLSEEDFAITKVSLKFEEKDKNVIAELNKGQTITIIGTIEGLGWDVDVKDCEIIDY